MPPWQTGGKRLSGPVNPVRKDGCFRSDGFSVPFTIGKGTVPAGHGGVAGLYSRESRDPGKAGIGIGKECGGNRQVNHVSGLAPA